MTKVRVFQIGCGKMSKYIMRYVYEKKGEIVGACDIKKELIGQDIGKIMESENKDIFISSVHDLDSMLKKTKPNVAVITTMSVLNDISSLVRTCICNGVHVLTTCEEAFFAENSNPIVYKELDSLAKANHVTLI